MGSNLPNAPNYLEDTEFSLGIKEMIGTAISGRVEIDFH